MRTKINKVLARLEKGEYEIEYVESCKCYFDWHVTRDGHLDDGCESDECWVSNALYVDNDLVAEFVRFEGWKLYVDNLEVDDLPDEVIQRMELPYVVERGEIVNKKHYERRRKALVEFLMEGDYELGKDAERGFANEYTMTLKPVASPIHVTLEEAEQWADDFLYEGDAATEAFVGFALIRD
jgi:hypothetical protein